MARYKLLSEKTKDAHGASILIYGVSGDGVESHSLSCDKDKVKSLIKIFNNNELSYIHFYDVIEDMRDELAAL